MQESSLAKIPQTDVKLEIDDPLTHEEIKKATVQLKVGKSHGLDSVQAEVYQDGGEATSGKKKQAKKDETARPTGVGRE